MWSIWSIAFAIVSAFSIDTLYKSPFFSYCLFFFSSVFTLSSALSFSFIFSPSFFFFSPSTGKH